MVSGVLAFFPLIRSRDTVPRIAGSIRVASRQEIGQKYATFGRVPLGSYSRRSPWFKWSRRSAKSPLALQHRLVKNEG